MSRKILLATFALGVFSWLSFSVSGSEIGNPEVVAKYTADTVRLDGKLDEAAWAKAPAYSLQLPFKAYTGLPESTQRNIGDMLREKGTAKLLWDNNYLYVGVEFDDSDVMNEGKEDQSHFYTSGDLLEVFLKPAKENYYWEIYGTPHNKRTWFSFPSRGRVMFPACAGYLPDDLKLAASVEGTFNKCTDKDKGWTLEMAIPIKELTVYGAKFDNSANWTILLARYNYSAYLEKAELSSYPKLSNVNWHTYEEYAGLRLEK